MRNIKQINTFFSVFNIFYFKRILLSLFIGINFVFVSNIFPQSKEEILTSNNYLYDSISVSAKGMSFTKEKIYNKISESLVEFLFQERQYTARLSGKFETIEFMAMKEFFKLHKIGFAEMKYRILKKNISTSSYDAGKDLDALRKGSSQSSYYAVKDFGKVDPDKPPEVKEEAPLDSNAQFVNQYLLGYLHKESIPDMLKRYVVKFTDAGNTAILNNNLDVAIEQYYSAYLVNVFIADEKEFEKNQISLSKKIEAFLNDPYLSVVAQPFAYNTQTNESSAEILFFYKGKPVNNLWVSYDVTKPTFETLLDYKSKLSFFNFPKTAIETKKITIGPLLNKKETKLAQMQCLYETNKLSFIREIKLDFSKIPVLDFTVTTENNQTVFTPTYSRVIPQKIVWNFGDGKTDSTIFEPEKIIDTQKKHVFDISKGTYLVKMQMNNSPEFYIEKKIKTAENRNGDSVKSMVSLPSPEVKKDTTIIKPVAMIEKKDTVAIKPPVISVDKKDTITIKPSIVSIEKKDTIVSKQALAVDTLPEPEITKEIPVVVKSVSTTEKPRPIEEKKEVVIAKSPEVPESPLAKESEKSLPEKKEIASKAEINNVDDDNIEKRIINQVLQDKSNIQKIASFLEREKFKGNIVIGKRDDFINSNKCYVIAVDRTNRTLYALLDKRIKNDGDFRTNLLNKEKIDLTQLVRKNKDYLLLWIQID